MTAPRRAVARVLEETDGWLSPEAIADRARGSCPSLGLVTVYRTLDLLERLALVRRVHGPDGCHGYAASVKPHGHYIVCRACRQVVEFDGCGVGQVAARVSRRTGFVVENHMLELQGLCPTCRTRTPRRPNGPAASRTETGKA